MNKNEYKCAECGGVYTKGWSEEEADQEAKENWGVEEAHTDKDMDIVCDDCYKKIIG